MSAVHSNILLCLLMQLRTDAIMFEADSDEVGVTQDWDLSSAASDTQVGR